MTAAPLTAPMMGLVCGGTGDSGKATVPVLALELHPGGEVGEVEPGAERGVLAGEDRRVDVVVGLALRQAGADRRRSARR